MTDIAGKGFLQVYTHNLKVVGSNPTPATNKINYLAALMGGFFFVRSQKIRRFLSAYFSCSQEKGKGHKGVDLNVRKAYYS